MLWIDPSDIDHTWWLVYLQSLCLLLVIIILIQISCKIYWSAQKPKKSIIVFSLFGIVSFIINLMSGIFYFTRQNVNNKAPSNQTLDIGIDVTNALFWNTAHVSIYIVLFSNLYFSFKDTPYNLSVPSSMLVSSLITLFFVLGIVYAVNESLHTADITSATIFATATIIKEVLAEIVDFILSVILCYAFVKRLKILSQLNDQNQVSVLYIARKYVILAILFIISTQMVLISEMIAKLCYVKSLTFFKIAFECHWSLLYLDCVVSSFCVSLILECNDRYYRYFCCQSRINNQTRNVSLNGYSTENTKINRNSTINTSKYSRLLAK